MRPLISLITPVYNTKEVWLRACLESVLNQTFQDWELCLCNNGSDPYIFEILDEYAKRDSRLRVNYTFPNRGGYKGLEEALNISTGQYVGLLDSDDTMPDYALHSIFMALSAYHPDVLYTDEIAVDSNGKSFLSFIKPDFDRLLLCQLHYWGHLTVYRSAVIKRLGIRHCGGSYDYDLALRASEILTDKDIYHIPEFLYNYRIYPESTSATTRESCMLGGLMTLQQHLDLKYEGAVASINGPIYQVIQKDGEI